MPTFSQPSDQAVAVDRAVAEHHPVMRIHGPCSLRLHTYVTRFSLGIQKEAVIGHNDGFFEAHPTKLVQCDSNQLQRASDQP